MRIYSRFRAAACGMALILLLGILAQRAASQDSKVVVVSLRPTAEVDAPTITLASVAEVRGGDARLRETIAGLDVADVAQGRREVAVLRDQVAYRLQLAGIEPRLFRMEGAARSLVTRIVTPLTEERLLAVARKALLEKFGARSEDVEVQLAQPMRLPPSVTGLPPEEVQLDYEVRATKLATGSMRVDVTISANERRVALVPIMLQVRLHQEMAVALQRIEKGEIVGEHMIRRERRPVSGKEALPSVGELLGKRTLRSIPQGQALGAEDVDVPAIEGAVLVRPRDGVRLMVRVGAAWVTATGEALQEGRLGQSIRVRNTASGKIVVGRVVQRGVVEVDY